MKVVPRLSAVSPLTTEHIAANESTDGCYWKWSHNLYVLVKISLGSMTALSTVFIAPCSLKLGFYVRVRVKHTGTPPRSLAANGRCSFSRNLLLVRTSLVELSYSHQCEVLVDLLKCG